MASGPHPPLDNAPAPLGESTHAPGGPPTPPPRYVPAADAGPVTRRDSQSLAAARDGSGPRPSPDTLAASHTPPTAGPRAVLRVVRGETPNVPFVLLAGRNYVGRATPDRPVDVDLTGQEAAERVWSSRQHAVVTVDRGAVFVEDLNSLNGTFLNRVRLHPGQPKSLQPGDVIQVGTVQLRLEIDTSV